MGFRITSSNIIFSVFLFCYTLPIILTISSVLFEYIDYFRYGTLIQKLVTNDSDEFLTNLYLQYDYLRYLTGYLI